MSASENKDLKDGFAKYRAGHISREEFHELIRKVNLYTDDELYPVLLDSWNNWEGTGEMSPDEARELLLRTRKEAYIDVATETRRMDWRWLAAMIVFLVMGSLSAYLYMDNRHITQLAERTMEVNAGKGERVSITLPDGTKVKLNSESVLSYKQNFGKKERRVTLSGEGYFEVQKDLQKKFVVHTEYMDVEVTGTSFNVYAYSDKDITEMALVDGHVTVSSVHPPYEKLNVIPNEKVVYDKKTGRLEKMATSNRLETAWMSRELVFRSEPMDVVLKKIARKYGVSIDVADSFWVNETYTGVFDEEEIEEVMDILKFHYGFDYKIKEDDIKLFVKEK